jgi:hypothetical protein
MRRSLGTYVVKPDLGNERNEASGPAGILRVLPAGPWLLGRASRKLSTSSLFRGDLDQSDGGHAAGHREARKCHD